MSAGLAAAEGAEQSRWEGVGAAEGSVLHVDYPVTGSGSGYWRGGSCCWQLPGAGRSVAGVSVGRVGASVEEAGEVQRERMDLG